MKREVVMTLNNIISCVCFRRPVNHLQCNKGQQVFTILTAPAHIPLDAGVFLPFIWTCAVQESYPLWLTQWPYGFCCPQGGPGAGLQTDQSGNHAPPTEINTHFLSSLSHWFFPHSSNPHAVARPAQRKWQTTSRGLPLLWQECLRQPSGERETLSHSSGGCKLFVCLLQTAHPNKNGFTLILNHAWPTFTIFTPDAVKECH